MLLRRAAAALSGWTFLVWTTRLRNIWTDDGLSAGDRWARSALALSFTALAALAVVGLVRRAAWRGRAVRALAGWTVVVWAVRAVQIAAADHAIGFVAVHLVLAVVSIGLAVLAVREGSPSTASPGDVSALR